MPLTCITFLNMCIVLFCFSARGANKEYMQIASKILSHLNLFYVDRIIKHGLIFDIGI